MTNATAKKSADHALVIVDVQNDFVTGGALGIDHGEEVVPVANMTAPKFSIVVATQDWHPANHGSFASNNPPRQPGEFIELGGIRQVLWPDHCVQGSSGAQFHPDLHVTQLTRVFRKGTDPEIDSYSAFFDNAHRKSTGLGEWLKAQHVTDVYLLGLATDYCVKFSALDAIGFGFRTYVVEDGVRGVNLNLNDSADAVEEMKRAGVVFVSSAEL